VSTRQALHRLIDALDEARVEDLLERVEAELLEIPELTPEAMASIARGLSEAAAGAGIPHEQAMHLVGLDP